MWEQGSEGQALFPSRQRYSCNIAYFLALDAVLLLVFFNY
jgi:hypothetical protein